MEDINWKPPLEYMTDGYYVNKAASVKAGGIFLLYYSFIVYIQMVW